MKTRYLTLLITLALGIVIGIVFVEIYRHYNLKQEQQKALIDSATKVTEDTITILKKFQEKNEEISQHKNDSSLQSMILPQIKFIVCFVNNGYSNKVKISDEEEAFLIGNDTCGEGVNGELLKGLLLDKDTKSKDVVFIRKDQPKIAETINITYDDGAFTLTRPNGHVITSVNPKN